jgi:hypothetical protein
MWGFFLSAPPTLVSLANMQMQKSRRLCPAVSACCLPAVLSPFTRSEVEVGRQGRVGWEVGQVTAGDTKLSSSSLARTVSRWGRAHASHSGIVFLACPVDMLEQGHGEGHAQDLKDKRCP